MADLTIEVDDSTLKDARMRTLAEGTDTPSRAGVGGDGAYDCHNFARVPVPLRARRAGSYGDCLS